MQGDRALRQVRRPLSRVQRPAFKQGCNRPRVRGRNYEAPPRPHTAEPREARRLEGRGRSLEQLHVAVDPAWESPRMNFVDCRLRGVPSAMPSSFAIASPIFGEFFMVPQIRSGKDLFVLCSLLVNLPPRRRQAS